MLRFGGISILAAAVSGTSACAAAGGLPHFSGVRIWNLKATGARRAFDVAAMPDAPLVDFQFDHISIQAQSAGRVADTKDWRLNNVEVQTADGSKIAFTDSTGLECKDLSKAAGVCGPRSFLIDIVAHSRQAEGRPGELFRMRCGSFPFYERFVFTPYNRMTRGYVEN